MNIQFQGVVIKADRYLTVWIQPYENDIETLTQVYGTLSTEDFTLALNNMADNDLFIGKPIIINFSSTVERAREKDLIEVKHLRIQTTTPPPPIETKEETTTILNELDKLKAQNIMLLNACQAWRKAVYHDQENRPWSIEEWQEAGRLRDIALLATQGNL